MVARNYIATVHLLVALDEHPNMGSGQPAACDAISEWLRESPEIVDWGYARTTVRVPQACEHPDSDGRWAGAVQKFEELAAERGIVLEPQEEAA